MYLTHLCHHVVASGHQCPDLGIVTGPGIAVTHPGLRTPHRRYLVRLLDGNPRS